VRDERAESQSALLSRKETGQRSINNDFPAGLNSPAKRSEYSAFLEIRGSSSASARSLDSINVAPPKYGASIMKGASTCGSYTSFL